MPRTNAPNNNHEQSEMLALRTLATQFVRSGGFGGMGNQFAGKRNVYEACGYPTTDNIPFGTYMELYSREDLASRVIDAYPDAAWKRNPEIREGDEGSETETQFEKAVRELDEEHKIWHYLHRLDKLMGIGRYGCMLMGINDGMPLDQPAEPGNRELIYQKPLTEGDAKVSAWEMDPSNIRYGLPTMYEVAIPFGDDTEKALGVHHTRIFHAAGDLTTSDVYGTPRLQRVLNRLMDLQKVVGGGSEMFWMGGFPGMSFETEGGAALPGKEAMKEEIEKFVHGLQRYLRLQGVKANMLQTQVADPSNHVDVILKLVSGTTRIPVRILTGSEMGELASTQDRDNWRDRVRERRENTVEPVLVHGYLDTLVGLGVLPPPGGEYRVEWTEEQELSRIEQVDVGYNVAKALGEYVKNPQTGLIIPPLPFLTDVLGFEKEQAEGWLAEGQYEPDLEAPDPDNQGGAVEPDMEE